MAGKRLPHGSLVRVRLVVQELGERHQYPGGKEPTLLPSLGVQGLLRQVGLSPCLQPLYRTYLTAWRLPRQHQAASGRMAVQQHGAGTANTMLAASMRSRESKLIAQAIRQRRTRLHNSVAFFAVYLEYDRMQLVFICTTHYKPRSEEHTSELQSLMRISYSVFCFITHKHNHNK